MMDELAHAANMDALEFRRRTRRTTAGAPCSTAAAGANWQSRVSASKLSNERFVTGRGIAIAGENHANDDVQAGVVAEVEVDRKTGKIIVKHLCGAQDSGVVVNPASAENQISGMLVRGASRTIFEQVTFSKKRVTGLDWVSYPILRFKESPTVTPIVIWHQDEVTDVAAVADRASGPALPRRRRVDRGRRCRRRSATRSSTRPACACGRSAHAGQGAQGARRGRPPVEG